MAYDKAKAHEYYMKYRKKGLLKGRKASVNANHKLNKNYNPPVKSTGTGKKGKKAKKVALKGLSTSGLNEAGKAQAAAIKEQYTAEMNKALSKAKTDADKERIKQEYQNKAAQEIQKLKSDSKYANAKKSSGGSKGSSGSSKSSGGSGSKSSGSGSGSTSSTKADAEAAKAAENAAKKFEASVNVLNEILTGLGDKLDRLDEGKKAEAKRVLNNILAELKKHLGTDTTKYEKLKEALTKTEE